MSGEVPAIHRRALSGFYPFFSREYKYLQLTVPAVNSSGSDLMKSNWQFPAADMNGNKRRIDRWAGG